MANKEIVKEISNLFSLPTENYVKQELVQLSKLPKKNNFQEKILKNYSGKNKFDEKDLNNFRADVCSQLIKSKEDFLSCIKIYQISTDYTKVQTLQKYFIIPQGNLIQPKDISEYSKSQANLSLNLLSTYDDGEYFRIFIKGILLILGKLFNKKYILEYLPPNYFDRKESEKYYFDHIKEFQNSLNKILVNINRILSEDKNLEEKKDKGSLYNESEVGDEKISFNNYKRLMRISRIKEEFTRSEKERFQKNLV